MASVIGALRVSLGLDSSQFQEGLKQSNSSLVAWGKKAAFAAAGIATAGAAAYASFNRAADTMGELQKQADIAGMSAQDFKIAALAVEQYGISQEKLSDILKDVNDKFGDFAATGGGELKDFFDNIAPKVGLTIDSFRNLSSSDALALYVTALEQANVSQQEMTFYMEALANDATALVPAFRDNGSAIKEMADRARELGLAIDEGLIKQTREAQGEIRLMQDVLGVQFQQAILKLGPALSQLAAALMPVVDGLVWLIEETLHWTDVAGDFVREGVLKIIDGLGQLPASASLAATEIVLRLSEGLSGIVDAAVEAIRSFGTALSAGMASLAQSAIQWGKDIVQGIIDGVKQMASGLKDTVTNMASDAANAVKGFFQIRSPSRLMMGYGQNIAEGLAIGIGQGAGGPVSAMQDMASGMSGVFKSMLLEGRSFGDQMRSMLSGLFDGWAGKAWDAGWSGLMGAIGLPSFAGGGYTGDGSRTGGLDGQGGRLALLRPQETVIDHTRGQGVASGIERIHITASFDETGNLYVRDVARQEALQAGLAVSQSVPRQIQRFNANPRRRY